MANRVQLYQYKGNRCAHCGLSVEEMLKRFGTVNRMFQFNHVDPSKKHPDYESLIERVLSTNQLNEVDKCVLMCNQCHGILHAQDINGEMVLRVVIEGRSAEQKLKGQIIFDNLDKHATFLTNERVLTIPYRVSVGGAKSVMRFGTELEQGEVLNDYLRNIATHKKVEIRSWIRCDLLMRAEHTGGKTFNLKHAIRLPFFTSELLDEEGKSVLLWIRNGVGLTKDGRVLRGHMVTLEGCCF
jgi:hypothetical protein